MAFSKNGKIVPLAELAKVPYSKTFDGKRYDLFISSHSKLSQEIEARKMRKAGALVRMVTTALEGKKVYTLYTWWPVRR